MTPLPELFLKRLPDIIPDAYHELVKRGFETPTEMSGRVNSLKTDKNRVLTRLAQLGASCEEVPWCPEALTVTNVERKVLTDLDIVNEGLFYLQGLSSCLPAVLLDPAPGERVLDLCAAPGSKTTQMAALMRNEGTIVALEAVRNRFYKLRSVVELMGARNVQCKIGDGRRFKSGELFDKILIDVPCSSEGRFKVFDEKSFAYWSPRKIKEMVRKQRGLLLAAGRLLKPEGVLVYSTCTFAPEENEGVIDWFLRKTDGDFEVVPAPDHEIRTYPAVMEWGKRRYDPRVRHCLRVLPDERMEGFFVAKIRRNNK
jgi:16S rRNA (cytosine1407-C5)-methyltransferase